MRIIVHGGRPLQGTFRPSGNSNAALALTAAALLTDAEVTLNGVPDTLSTAMMLDAAKILGTAVVRDGGTVRLHTPALHTRTLEQDFTDTQVSTVMFLAPILARRRYARMEIAYSVSRLHTHLAALRDLGVAVTMTGGVLDFQATEWDRRDITLMQTSVTATSLVCMLAASLGRETVIRNAASEPHVQDLQRMLVGMGAQIEGIGSNVVVVRGSDALTGGAFHLSPDHIEIASVAAIGAITHGTLTVEGVVPEHMHMITRVLGRLGVQLVSERHRAFFARARPARSLAARGRPGRVDRNHTVAGLSLGPGRHRDPGRHPGPWDDPHPREAVQQPAALRR